MAGVACRGHIDLDDIAVRLEVEPRALDEASVGVRERITLKGSFDEPQLVRLRRTAAYCPVGQMLTRRSVTIEDRFELVDQGGSPGGGEAPTLSNSGPAAALLPGTVEGRYLPDTQEWHTEGDTRTLLHEGEAVVHITCQGRTRSRHWGLLGGHTGQGWGPWPVDMALAGLAASNVSTLRQLLAPAALGPEDLQVVISWGSSGGGGRGQAQMNAAAGVAIERQVVRTVRTGGAMRGIPRAAIEAALRRDPLYRYFETGDILIGEAVLQVVPGA